MAILLFIAFVLLLISVISTPIVKAIPLATFNGVDYGVFGYCKGKTCTGPKIGYGTGESPYLEGVEAEEKRVQVNNHLKEALLPLRNEAAEAILTDVLFQIAMPASLFRRVHDTHCHPY